MSGPRGVVQNHYAMLARLHGAEIASHAESFRLQTGAVAADLGALEKFLGRKLPVDPFGGQAYRFVRSPTGYTIYSVGPNGTDEGGDRSLASGFPDISFVVSFLSNDD